MTASTVQSPPGTARLGDLQLPHPDLLVRAGHLLVDALVMLFAAWTLVYQLCLTVGWGVDTVGLLTLAVVAVAAAVWLARSGLPWRRVPVGRSVVVEVTPGVPRAELIWLGAALAVAGVVFVLLEVVRAPAAAALVAAVGFAVLLVRLAWSVGSDRRRVGHDEVVRIATAAQQRLWVVAWVLGLLLAEVAAVTFRADGDDAYFVNFSAWVSERGSLPQRDTLFTDQVLPGLSSHTPPVHSIEALFGGLARWAGLGAPTVVYVLMPPVLTLLAVLALARAIEQVRLRHPATALTGAVLFLLADGGASASFGIFHFVRIWQGKALFVAAFVPLLFAYAVRQIRVGGWRSWLLLAGAVVGSIGATNTSVMLLPLLLVAFLPAALAHGGPRRAAALLAPVAYPLMVGLVIVLAAPTATGKSGGALAGAAEVPAPELPPPPTTTTEIISFVAGHRGQLLVYLLALALGWLGTRDRIARLVLVGPLLLLAVFFLGPPLHLLGSLTGTESVVWRVWWLVPVPLLVAALTSLLADLVPRSSGLPWLAAFVLPLVALVGSHPLISQTNGIALTSPLSWRTPNDPRAEVGLVRKVTHRGEMVAAPWDVMRAVSLRTVRIRTVAPRITYLFDYGDYPGFHLADRRALQQFADWRDDVDPRELDGQLRTMQVRVVCLRPQRVEAAEIIQSLGYAKVGDRMALTCYRR